MQSLLNQTIKEKFEERTKLIVRRIYLELYRIDKNIYQCTYLNHLAIRYEGHILLFVNNQSIIYFRNFDETIFWINSRYPHIKVYQDEDMLYQWFRVSHTSDREKVLIALKSLYSLWKKLKK